MLRECSRWRRRWTGPRPESSPWSTAIGRSPSPPGKWESYSFWDSSWSRGSRPWPRCRTRWHWRRRSCSSWCWPSQCSRAWWSRLFWESSPRARSRGCLGSEASCWTTGKTRFRCTRCTRPGKGRFGTRPLPPGGRRGRSRTQCRARSTGRPRFWWLWSRTDWLGLWPRCRRFDLPVWLWSAACRSSWTGTQLTPRFCHTSQSWWCWKRSMRFAGVGRHRC